MGTRPTIESIEQQAKELGYIALLLDQEAAAFYIQLLADFHATEETWNTNASADAQYLRARSRWMWGDPNQKEQR